MAPLYVRISNVNYNNNNTVFYLIVLKQRSSIGKTTTTLLPGGGGGMTMTDLESCKFGTAACNVGEKEKGTKNTKRKQRKKKEREAKNEYWRKQKESRMFQEYYY